MQLVKKYPILGSSANPDKLSMTVQGLAVYVIPIVIVLAKNFGVGLAEADLTQLVNQVALFVATAVTIYGLGRKIVKKFKKG